MVKNLNYMFMSGDKTFVFLRENQLYVSGWPDYPHLGLVPPGTVCKIDKILYPAVSSSNFAMEEYEEHVTELRKHVESSYGGKYPDWHRYIIKSEEAGSLNGVYFQKLSEVPAYRLSGSDFVTII